MGTFRTFAVLVTALTIVAPNFSRLSGGIAGAFAQETTTVSDEAQLLYEDAIEQKKKGRLAEAITSYISALRKDRTVLAFDDSGLIQASYDDAVAKLKAAPEDVKLLELCGFLASVGFSDNKTAISYYEKIIDLVKDEGVKNRTQNLIERLYATSQAQQTYDAAVAASMRDERIKAWAEMEKIDNFTQERSEANERSERLNEAYSNRESLQNRVPQLEDELKELQEAYDKADRLWYTLKDELYERRRRRLKNDLAAKEEEIAVAKKELKSVESEVAKLEKLDNEARRTEESSAFNPSDDREPEDEDSAFNSDPSGYHSSGRELDSSGSRSYENAPSEGYEDEYGEEALANQADEMSDEERQEQLDDLIDNL